MHPAGRALTSDLSANSFIMVVPSGPISFSFMQVLAKSRFSAQNQRLRLPSGKSWIRHWISLKLFFYHSEVSVLPAGCEWKGKVGVNGFKGNIHIAQILKRNSAYTLAIAECEHTLRHFQLEKICFWQIFFNSQCTAMVLHTLLFQCHIQC